MSSKVPVYIKWGKKLYYSVHDFLKYRMLMSTRNLLIIGGSNEVGKQIIDQFKNNWRVVNLDYNKACNANDNIQIDIQQTIDQKYYQEIEQKVKKLNIQFDSVICIPQSQQYQTNVKQIQIQDKQIQEDDKQVQYKEKQMDDISDMNIFDKFDNDIQQVLVPTIIGGSLSRRYTANNAILIICGSGIPFDNTIDQLTKNNNNQDSNSNQDNDLLNNNNDNIIFDHYYSYSSIMNCTHMLGLNLNADNDMPNDLTITTALPYHFNYINNNNYKEQESSVDIQAFAKVLRQWSDGKYKPHSNSIAKFKTNNKGRLYWQFI